MNQFLVMIPYYPKYSSISFLKTKLNLLHNHIITLKIRKFELTMHAQSLSHIRLLATPWTVARQAPLSMGFSRQEHWSGLPCPPPGDFLNPGVKPRSATLHTDSLPSEPPGKLLIIRFGTAISQKRHYALSILTGGIQYWFVPVIGKVSYDHTVKLLSARILHYKVIIFL